MSIHVFGEYRLTPFLLNSTIIAETKPTIKDDIIIASAGFAKTFPKTTNCPKNKYAI